MEIQMILLSQMIRFHERQQQKYLTLAFGLTGSNASFTRYVMMYIGQQTYIKALASNNIVLDIVMATFIPNNYYY